MARKDTIKLGFEIDGMDESLNQLEQAVDEVKSLKQQLAEAEDAAIDLAGQPIVDQVELQKAIEKAGRLKSVVEETNQQIDLFASSSKYERVSRSLGGVRESLMSLNFEEASQRANTLATAAGDISFKDATKSLKGLGSTFINLGKSLLTNPLFLLAAAIVGIVLVIKELMDQVGLTKVIMEQLGKVFEVLMIPIDAMIQTLKDLTDWLGWTNNAAEDLAEANSVAMTNMANKSSEATAQIVQDLDNQIRMAQLLGESTEELERTRIEQLEANALAQATAAAAEYEAARIKGELTDEEIEDLRLKSEEQRLSYEQAAANTAYFEAQMTKKKQDEEAARTKAEEDAENERKIKREANAKQRIADAEAEAQRLLGVERRIQDLALTLMEEGADKEILQNQLKYDRLIEDTLNNEKLTATEKQTLVDYYEKLAQQKEDEIVAEQDAKKAQQNAREMEAERAKQELKTNLQLTYMQEGVVKEQAIRTLAYEKEVSDLRSQLQQGLITKEEFDEYEKEAERRLQADLTQIEKTSNDEKVALKQAEMSSKFDLAMQAMGALQALTQAFAKEDERSAKRAFQINKALSLGITIAQTAQGIMVALAGPKDALTGQNFVKAGIVAATGAAQIATIMKSQFTPSGGGGGGTNPVGVVTSSATANIPTQTAPNALNPIGEENTGSQLFGMQNAGSRQGVEVRAYVVESDITGTQERLSTYQNRSEIG